MRGRLFRTALATERDHRHDQEERTSRHRDEFAAAATGCHGERIRPSPLDAGEAIRARRDAELGRIEDRSDFRGRQVADA